MLDFLFNFDKDFYSFNRLVKDMRPYSKKYYDDHMVLVHNVVGVSENDLSINIENENNTAYLVIKGETKDEILETTYSVNSRFSVDANKVDNIEYSLKDGLLYIYIYYKEPIKSNISIKKK